MSESKLKSPGQIKGPGYKKAQRAPIRARWYALAELKDRWPERHIPGYVARRAKKLAERARKEAKAAGKGKGAGDGPPPVVGQNNENSAADSGLNKKEI